MTASTTPPLRIAAQVPVSLDPEAVALQLAETNRKLDLLVQQVGHLHQRYQAMEELKDELVRIARDGIDTAMKVHELDALIAPTNGPSWMTDHVNGDHYSISRSSLAAISGYASITVPAGYVFDLPAGLSFIGGPFSEHALIKMAYAFEQAAQARRAPEL